jgi:predicted nuclease of predicted toxin-antitoxin system
VAAFNFYADENFRYPVVEALRRLGHDVVTCQEAGRAGQRIDDATVLDDAQRAGRILLTQNRDDFKKLHRKGLPHHGIVVCTYDPDAGAIARRITDAVSREEPGSRWLASVVRPNPRGRTAKKRR